MVTLQTAKSAARGKESGLDHIQRTKDMGTLVRGPGTIHIIVVINNNQRWTVTIMHTTERALS